MKVQNRQQMLVILTAIAAALLIGTNFVYEPLARWWTARAQEIATLREQVKEGKLMLGRESVIRGEWKDMRANALPANTSQAAQQVINAIDNWSQSSGAQLTSIMPQWKNDSTNYMTYNCRVEASGTLSTLSQFLYDTEKGPMALKLDSVELSAHDETGQQLTLGLQISGLSLLLPPAK